MAKSAPHYLVAIDPGKKHNGYAIFELGVLIEADLVKGHGALDAARNTARTVNSFPSGFNKLVVEDQQLYRGVSRANPNDMLAVAYASGALAALIPHTELIQPMPRVWTRGRPKNIRHARLADAVRSPLTDDEMQILLNIKLPQTLLHNVWDAVELGLYVLKRDRVARIGG
jgi:hypothetical protein